MIDGVTVTELSSARFIYNGWDIIAEYSVLNGSTLDKLQRTFAWGVDIAGSLADAGGVGALLQFVNSATGTTYLPSFDGNGNVASLINLGTGALAAAYEYSPYGEMLRDEIHDNAVSSFALRFSTKWRDAETSWLNYGRRYFDPRNGRFIGRDPIAEEGGINLYAFCGNNPVDRWDRLGMESNSYWTQLLDIIRWFEEEIGIDNLTDDQRNEYAYWLDEKGRVDVFDIAPNRYSPEPTFDTDAYGGTLPFHLQSLYFGDWINGMHLDALDFESTGDENSSVVGGVLGSIVSGALDLIGKVWNLPNTAIGLVFGGVGYVAGLIQGTNPAISIANNAIQFTNVPTWLMPSAITLGNTITYGGQPSDPAYSPGLDAATGGRVIYNGTTGEHERQHTYQGQLLGPLYLPSNILGMAAGMIFNRDHHGSANWNERGPQSTTPVPWNFGPYP